MAAGVRTDFPAKVRRGRLIAMVALAGFMVGGTAACSSDQPDTVVRGEVLTRGDASLGGPGPALEEFRAGERAVYGTGP
jgi:hypothetical protein